MFLGLMRYLLLAMVLSCSLFVARSEGQPITIFTYHDKAPFILDKSNNIGIYYDLAKYLNKRQSNYQFKTSYIPRKRLNYMINNKNFNGVVVGVTPIWFKDKNETKFLWLDGIIDDRDEFISLAKSPFIYENTQSLLNKTMVTVAGYYYFGVTELVRQDKLKVIETVGELQVLKLLSKQRADFGIVSQSSFRYFAKHLQIDPSKYYRSDIPHDQFTRRAFVDKENKQLFKTLQPIFANMINDKQWIKIINQYQ